MQNVLRQWAANVDRRAGTALVAGPADLQDIVTTSLGQAFAPPTVLASVLVLTSPPLPAKHLSATVPLLSGKHVSHGCSHCRHPISPPLKAI